MTRVVIALGSNLGDRLGNLRAAIAALATRGVTPVTRSSVWETEPVPSGQPPFLNAAITAETGLSPPDLLAALKAIEYQLGRRPGPRWGPRPIDLDILFYGEESIETDTLVIPHPRISERAFVLAPLSEVAHGPLPGLSRSAAELLIAVGLQGAVRTSDPL